MDEEGNFIETEAPKGTRMPDGVRTGSGVRLPGGSRAPEDERLPEGFRTPEDERLPEGSRTSEDERLPEGSRTPEDERLPEGEQIPRGGRIIRPVAVIHTGFSSKFGIPRQSNLVSGLMGEVTFFGKYNDPAAFRGLEEYSHIWLIWGFSESNRTKDSLVTFPPRLGGKVKRGVFATRSPYRPNSLGMSVVKLEKIVSDESGVRFVVSGADMLDGTPIYDVKPYLPYADAVPDAEGGLSGAAAGIEVDFPEELLNELPGDIRNVCEELLRQDPRDAYNKKAPGYVYGMEYAGYDIRFRADGNKLTVCSVVRTDDCDYQKVK